MSDTDNVIDKLDAHHRQQLSALLDGALPPDEAQFLLRRLQHDQELSACVGRWQLAGDVLRGRVDTLLPAGFAGQVADAVAREQAPAANASRRNWSRGLGVTALAASAALAAVLLTQRLPQQAGPGDTTPTIASAPVVSDPLQAAPAATGIAAIDASPIIDASPTGAAAFATQVPDMPRAVADIPATNAAEHGTDSARRNEAVRRPAAVGSTAVIATATPDILLPLPTANNPFLPSTSPPARPWPRAVLSDFPVSGFTASYGGSGEPASSFYPFEPRLPVAPQRDADPGGDIAGPDADPR